MADVVILGTARTPIGAFQGMLAGAPAPHLGAAAIRGALGKAAMPPDQVSDVFMGQVLQAGAGQAPARQAALSADIPASARCVTVNKVCGSGLQAVIEASRALQLGDADIAVAGGMENMSAAPYLLPEARQGYRLGHRQVVDSLVFDGLWDPYSDVHMGGCAEACARKFGFSRAEQDAYAVASFQRANAAQAQGCFRDEIVAVNVTDRRGRTVAVENDEGPARVDYEKLPTLRPAFEKSGTITAGNASTLNDGAAALVLATSETARRVGAAPIARIVAFGAHAQDPMWFTTAPIVAAQNVLQRAGWSRDDVDVWEVNEAFAVVPLAFMREMGVTPERLNVRGGAIALGHPIGASGARIVVTLLSVLEERGARRGAAVICIGGGEALAVCVERLPR